MVTMMRVDDRLIHGMVVVSWTSQLHPSAIVVANDKAAKDSFFSMTLKLAKPADVDLYIWTLEDACKKLDHPKLIKKPILLVTENMADALYMCEHYEGEIPTVNIGVGGLSKTPEMVPVLPEIFMGPEDFKKAKKMAEMGINVFAQTIPSKGKADMSDMAKIFEKSF